MGLQLAETLTLSTRGGDAEWPSHHLPSEPPYTSHRHSREDTPLPRFGDDCMATTTRHQAETHGLSPYGPGSAAKQT